MCKNDERSCMVRVETVVIDDKTCVQEEPVAVVSIKRRFEELNCRVSFKNFSRHCREQVNNNFSKFPRYTKCCLIGLVTLTSKACE